MQRTEIQERHKGNIGVGGHATGATLPKTGESDASGSQMSLCWNCRAVSCDCFNEKEKDAAKRETD